MLKSRRAYTWRRFSRVIVVLAALAFVSTILSAQETEDAKPLRPDDNSSLRWRAREARRLGKTSISVAAPNHETAQPEPLNAALGHTTLVLARFLGQATTHDEYFVITWRKYRVLEKFSPMVIFEEQPSEKFIDFVPASLLPIAPDEFVMPERAGTDVVDGVTVTMLRSENGVLPETRPLLMFLLFASSGAVAALNYGLQGAFWVDSSETLHLIQGPEGNGLGSELLKRSAGKLAGVGALMSVRTQPW